MGRVLAPLKRRLPPLSRNLRRDYDIRPQNPVGTEHFFPLEKFPLFSISIRADDDHIARQGWQLLGRLLNSFRVVNLIVI